MTDQTPIKTPFAEEGDKLDKIPDTSTSSVNWNTGFTPNYSKSLGESGAKLVSRKEINAILNAFSKAIRYIQIGGTAFWNATFAKTDGSEFQEGSIIWKKDGGYWFILEAKKNSPKSPDEKPDEWEWYTLAKYVDQKMKLKDVEATTLSVGGTGGIELANGKARGCPTPKNGTDFANKQYVDDNSAVIHGWPNYSAKSTITENSFTATSNGWIVVTHRELTTLIGKVKIGGLIVFSSNIAAYDTWTAIEQTSMIPVRKNDIVTFEYIREKYFVPAS